ncbi:hypothetical protein [Salinisphaera sp. Q1T1-3]|uniref:hypothetical protein n=1 Tax=Salinisphaera sp. Q1T1-3 TaxID=2321229 RepID=UPI001314BD5C|nr:hypothetical protein [Salinisphaera sp. Q1T1-3]
MTDRYTPLSVPWHPMATGVAAIADLPDRNDVSDIDASVFFTSAERWFYNFMILN